MSISKRTIDFLGIGGHACASTKLYHLLNLHPQIGFVHSSQEEGVDIRGKECHYWDKYSNRSIDWYLSYFLWEFPCVGEITPAYARLDETTVEKIHHYFPDVQVFFIIRNTLDRTWSNIRKNIVKQNIQQYDFQWILTQAQDPKTLLRNDYVRTVKIWNKIYSNQFHVILFDDFISRTREYMIKIANLLSVDTLFYEHLDDASLGMKVNRTVVDVEMPQLFRDWFQANSKFQWNEQLEAIKSIVPLL